MSKKTQHNNILLAIIGFVAVVAAVAVIGYLTIDRSEDVIQGQVEVEEYRVSSKVPGRILEIRVKEGDFVHAGDTVAILEAPEVNAKKTQAQSLEQAASAMSDMAEAGARQEQIAGAKQLWQQAEVGVDITKKSYERIQRLYDEGVVTAQKRDEVLAQYQAAQAQAKAAKSQYDMAVNGARQEEKRAAAAKVNQARGAIQEVNSYLRETIQVAQADGEVSSIYPKVGELVGTGSPIMTISMMDEVWGAFNVREDQLKGLKVGDTLTAYVPAFDKNVTLKVFNIKDMGSYATWKATKSSGQYDLKTFEVKAHPEKAFEGVRPGMSLVSK